MRCGTAAPLRLPATSLPAQTNIARASNARGHARSQVLLSERRARARRDTISVGLAGAERETGSELQIELLYFRASFPLLTLGASFQRAHAYLFSVGRKPRLRGFGSIHLVASVRDPARPREALHAPWAWSGVDVALIAPSSLSGCAPPTTCSTCCTSAARFMLLDAALTRRRV